MFHESGSLLFCEWKQTTPSRACECLMICEADLSASFKRFAGRVLDLSPSYIAGSTHQEARRLQISARNWPRLILSPEQASSHGGKAISHKHLVLLCSSNRSNSSKNLLQSDNTYIPPERRWYKLPVPSHSPELTKELWRQKPRLNTF